jgi:hypothetical protein
MRHCWDAFAHPHDELHDVSEDVLLWNVTVRLTDMRQNPLVPTQRPSGCVAASALPA